MEQILIDGKPVPVPAELLGGGEAAVEFWTKAYGTPVPAAVVIGGREAVSLWYAKQPGATKEPPKPPADVQAKGDRAVVEWYAENGHPVEGAAEIRADLAKRAPAKVDGAAAPKTAGAARRAEG